MVKRKVNKKQLKQKKPVLKIIWLLIGLLIIIWNVYWFVIVEINKDYGIVGHVIKYNLGIFALILYILINIIISLIKKFREYKSLKSHPYR
jgi:hypothetical protein